MFICGWCGNPTESKPCSTCGRDPLEFWDHVRRDLQTAPTGTPSGVHPNLAAHESLGLAATDNLAAYALDADLANHEDDTAAHGLANVVLTDDARLSDSRTPTSHDHAESDVTSLVGDLTAKADATHTHAEADVTDLAGDLSSKAASDHAHDAAYSALGHSHGGAQPYGVDDIYITTKNHADGAAVATHHGYGTWARFGAGRFLMFTDTTSEVQAGSATHAHSFSQPDAHGALSHGGATVADHAALSHSAHAGATVGNHTFTPPSAHGAISSHSGTAVGTSGAGSAHTHTQGAVTQPTIAWPAGVPTAATENAHTHTGASAGTTPKLFTSNTSTGVPGVSGGGSAHGHTLSWPAGVPTATLSAVANPANESTHTHASGTITQPDAHSALTNNHSGGGVDAHSIGQANAHSDHATQAHAVGQASDHGAQSHANGAVATGTTDPLSITAFAWKRTA